MKRFSDKLFDCLEFVIAAVIVFLPVVIIGSFAHSCSDEARAQARLEREAEKEAEYEKLSGLYYSVYDAADESYWKLANEYQELYEQYLNDPGRTQSLDSFTDPLELDSCLPYDYEYFMTKYYK